MRKPKVPETVRQSAMNVKERGMRIASVRGGEEAECEKAVTIYTIWAWDDPSPSLAYCTDKRRKSCDIKVLGLYRT